MNAAQALEFRRPYKTSPLLEKVFSSFRENVSFISEDALLHDYMYKSINFIKENNPIEILSLELEI